MFEQILSWGVQAIAIVWLMVVSAKIGEGKGDVSNLFERLRNVEKELGQLRVERQRRRDLERKLLEDA